MKVDVELTPTGRVRKRRARYHNAFQLPRGLHIPPTEWKPSIRTCRFCGSAFLPAGQWEQFCQESCIKGHKEKEQRSFAQQNVLKRIWKYNRIAGLPETNIGWSCAKCGISNNDFRFFDLDHIKPRKRGGSDSLNNLQILCPSCHRLKTIEDKLLGRPCFTKSPRKFPFSLSDKSERVTVPESNQVGGAAKVMRCEASNSAA